MAERYEKVKQFTTITSAILLSTSLLLSLIHILNDGGAQAAGAAAAANVSAGLQQAITESAGQVAVATATQVAPQTAESTVRGVAAQAKDSIGTSVAESVKTAAKTAAGTAAGQAAVEGAESAKKQIAASIEKKDKKTGYSLVSGMSALDTAVNGMSGKMPELTSGIDKLYTGSQTLTSKNDELNSCLLYTSRCV